MSKLNEIMKDYLTEDQLNTLKSVALASLGIGAGIPIVKELIRPESPIVLPSASGIGASIPVPEDDMKDSLPSYSRPTIKKQTGTVKGLKNYNPTAKFKEKRAAELADLTNPYYLPAAVAAVAAPLLGGNYLASKIIEHKNKSIVEDEISKAQDDFSKALLEVNSNRLNRDVRAHEPYSQAASDLYGAAKQLSGKALDKSKKLFAKRPKAEDMEAVKAGSTIPFNSNSEFSADLEKLASLELEKLAADPTIGTYIMEGVTMPFKYLNEKTRPRGPGEPEPTGIFRDAADAILGSFGDALKGTGKYIYDTALQPAIPALKGYGGALAAAGLLGLGAGTYFGHRAEKRDDKDTADSYKYLGEFLRRQQEEGTPVYATPTPVAKAKKPWYAF